MTDVSNLALFAAASWILIVTPGPDMLYVITRGAGQGRLAGLYSALGVCLGILVHTLFAALGLAVILRTSSLAFLAVKYAGAGYLVWLGIKTLKDGGSLVPGERGRAGYGRVFLQGALSNVLNPKVALFFLAFLPQFVRADCPNAAGPMIALGLIFAAFTLVFLGLVGFFSGTLGGWLTQNPKAGRLMSRTSGCVLIGLGVRLALPDRR